jgi:phage I-like protein
VTIRFSYYADLGSIQLDESGRGWIQAMRVGSYEHPRYGKLEFTLERLQRFAESVKRKVRGIDPDIDYDHKMDPARGREAAGWVKDAKVDGNALWLLVEWTKTAADKIKEKAYRHHQQAVPQGPAPS